MRYRKDTVGLAKQECYQLARWESKRLTALAVAVTRQCDDCIITHSDAAIKLGATNEEIVEALSLTVAVTAGPALIFSSRVMDAFNAKNYQ